MLRFPCAEVDRALTDGQLIEIARQTVNDVVSSQAVNAITVAFWRPETIDDKKTPAASVDWAPDGEWDKAETVASGEYSTHSYAVVRCITDRYLTNSQRYRAELRGARSMLASVFCPSYTEHVSFYGY